MADPSVTCGYSGNVRCLGAADDHGYEIFVEDNNRDFGKRQREEENEFFIQLEMEVRKTGAQSPAGGAEERVILKAISCEPANQDELR